MIANDLKIRNLDFIRQIPKIGARLFEALTDIKSGVSTIANQGNLNPNGDVPAPPNVQAVTATGANGVLTVSIQDQSAALNRDVQYVVEHADNPAFVSAEQRFIGATRSHSEFIGNATRYVRAYSTYGASSNSAHVYHGSPSAPSPVNGGGSVPPPVYQPSQGAGTGAPGQSGYGQGPTQTRDQSNGFDWTLQQPQSGRGGFRGQGTPAGNGAIGGGGGSGGGSGGGIVGAIVFVDTYANWTSAKYPPANYPAGTLFVISNRNNLTYQVQVVSSANTWVYYEGATALLQVALSGLTGYNGGALGTHDTGLLVNITDYAHILQWSGSAWNWGPGENGSGYFADFAVAPTGNGWHACDGSSGVDYLRHDGALATLTLPNTASTSAYRKSASAYASAITSADSPSIGGTTGTSTTGITVSSAAAATAGSGSINSAAVGTPVTVLEPPFSGGGGGGAVTDPGHSHTIGSITLPGDPVANYEAITYFRQ